MTHSPLVRGSEPFIALFAISFVLLALRLYASSVVGFGDAEALYASYANHPQPAYLDHPGLVGVVASILGGGAAPTPSRAHLVTSVLATLLPWIAAFACRACGAPWNRALAGGAVFALVPEMAVGLFALTPDLLLATAWIGALAFAAVGLRATDAGVRATLAFYAAGLLAGMASASKITGVLLFASLARTYASPAVRERSRSLAPWLGLAAGALVFAPIAAFEARSGWPMIRHRFVDTQMGAGLSFRNVGAFLGGQIVYLSPIVAGFVVVAARTAWRDWRASREPVALLLLTAFALPAVVLVPLCLWSRVAEPHWIAPALLAVLLAAARSRAAPSRRSVIAAASVGGVLVLAVYGWVLIPCAPRLAPASYDARLDLTNELYGWPEVISAVRHELVETSTPRSDFGDVVVVAPHWVLCAQLDAALRGDAPVGCDTPIEDDFDGWCPRRVWRNADTLVWVTDTRFGLPAIPSRYAIAASADVPIARGGRIVRSFTVLVLTRRGLS